MGFAAAALLLAACANDSVDERAMAVDAVAQAGVANGFPAYVVGASAPGIEFFASTAGLADTSADRAVALDDGFHIASITKSFTSVAILKLIDEGTLSFDDRLPDLLPVALIENIPFHEQMTVRQLLTHRTGLYSPNNDPDYWRPLIGPDADKPFYWSSEEIVAFAYDNDPLFEPGTDQQYGDINSVLLSLIVEQRAGIAYKDYVEKVIFDPLHMNRSYFLSDLAKNEPTPFPRARAYTVVSDILTEAFQFSDTFAQTDDGLADTTEGQERSDGAAGIISTAPDLHTFFRALFDGELLNSDSTQFLLSVADELSPENDKALGALRAYANALMASSSRPKATAPEPTPWSLIAPATARLHSLSQIYLAGSTKMTLCLKRRFRICLTLFQESLHRNRKRRTDADHALIRAIG